MDLQKLSQEAFETAKAHGWHDKELPDETYLMLIITEIAEAVQADRKNRHADIARFKECMNALERVGDDWFMTAFAEHIKNSVEDELADILVRCFDLYALRGIDIPNEKSFKAKKTLELPPFPVFAYALACEATAAFYNLKIILYFIVGHVILYCRQKNIDIDFFVEQKMRYNKLRDYKHGNNKY